MYKKVVLSLTLLLSIPVFAQLSFVDKDFTSFVNHIVPFAQRDQYAEYYEKITAQLKAKSPEERQKLCGDLYQTALKTLRIEHRAWADEIQSFLSDVRKLDTAFDTERTQLRDFLQYYGAFEAFQVTTKTKVAHIDSEKFMDKVKVKVADVTHKIGDWFKALKTKLT